MIWLQHWMAVHTGTVNEAGPYYGFFSGFGGQLTPNPSVVVAIAIAARHKNCHVKGCWRLGHPHEGTVRCRRHPHGT